MLHNKGPGGHDMVMGGAGLEALAIFYIIKRVVFI